MKHLWERIKQKCGVESATHTADGLEKPDPRPVEMPLGFAKPPSMHEMIQRHLRSHAIMQRQLARGEETLEDSMDYGSDDDGEDIPPTVHEMRVMAEETLAEGAREEKRQQRVSALKAKNPPKPATEAQDKPKAPAEGQVAPPDAK